MGFSMRFLMEMGGHFYDRPVLFNAQNFLADRLFSPFVSSNLDLNNVASKSSEIDIFSEKSKFLEISIFEWVSPDRISFVKIWVIIIGGIIRVYRIFRLVAQARLRIMQLVSVFLCKFMYFLSVWNKRGQKKRFNWFSDDVIIVVCLPDISSIYRTFSLINQ